MSMGEKGPGAQFGESVDATGEGDGTGVLHAST